MPIDFKKEPSKTIIETERLILREMVMTDLPAVWEIVGDDITMAAWNGAWSEEENLAGLEKQINGYRENGFGRWAVVQKDTGRVIGICGLQYCDTDKDSVLEKEIPQPSGQEKTEVFTFVPTAMLATRGGAVIVINEPLRSTLYIVQKPLCDLYGRVRGIEQHRYSIIVIVEINRADKHRDK